MTERILQGPMLTRRQAARLAGVPQQLLPDRPDLIHIGGDWLEEVYCQFQFDENGVRRDLGRVVHDLHREYSDVAIADWLVRPNAALNGTCPLDFLSGRGTVAQVLAAATDSPPLPDADEGQEQSPVSHWEEPPTPARQAKASKANRRAVPRGRATPSPA